MEKKYKHIILVEDYESSTSVQELLFAMGYKWNGGQNYYYAPYGDFPTMLFVSTGNNRITYSPPGGTSFEKYLNKAIDANVFIATNKGIIKDKRVNNLKSLKL